MNAATAFELIQHVTKGREQPEYCSDYGEPGYDDPPNGILFANWNHIPMYIYNGLERRGFALEWSDEWIIDYDNSKAYRTSPDSYSWTPSYIMTDDGDIWGRDEMPLDDYAEYLLNDPKRCDTTHRDFSSLGFTKMKDEFESGWHPGQTDNPKKILAEYQAKGFDCIFTIDSKGQFDVNFSVWTRPVGEN